MTTQNLKPIRRGDTWSMRLKFYEDADKATPIDVAAYSFKLIAKNDAGAVQFTWNNVDFALTTETYERVLTLTSATTASYNLGEFKYDLQVTTNSGIYTYWSGYVRVIEQITS